MSHARDGVTGRILVVEDAPEFAQLITGVLRNDGYSVRTAGTIKEGATSLRSSPADLVILDLGLPDGDGLDFCRSIRETTSTCVLMLTGRTDEVDMLMGFRNGADDYLTKPFSPRELVARVGAILGRSGHDEIARLNAPRQVGDLQIDVEARMVRIGGDPIDLTKIEFDLLGALSARPNVVLTRENLLSSVWGDNYIGDDHVVDVHIANLRKKIDIKGGPSQVRTVRGVGYSMQQ